MLGVAVRDRPARRAPSATRRSATGGGRAKHDAVVAVVRATARGQVGVVTSRGRVLRLGVLDLPALPDTATRRTCRAALRSASSSRSTPVSGCSRCAALATDAPGLALGTRGRGQAGEARSASNRDAWDVIRLDDGDRVVGAVELVTDDEEPAS